MRAKKVFLYLNPDNQAHKKVLKYLDGFGASATEAIVAAVLAYLQGPANEAALIEAVKSTITESLSQQVPATTGPLVDETSEVDRNDETVNDFLSFFKK